MTPLEEMSSVKADPLLQRLPKCNLHTHLEGSVRVSTFIDLAKSQGFGLELSEKEVKKALQVSGEVESLIDYLKKISYTYQVLNNPHALQRTAYEAVEDAARDGVRYLELRAGPVTHIAPKFSVNKVIGSILKGIREAEKSFDISCGLIVSALRGHDPKVNVRLAYTTLDFKNQGVVGFDLAGDEAGYPAEMHAKAIHIAREGGLGITIHAGEAGGAKNVRYAVEELHARRIGHGVKSIQSDRAVDLIKKESVLLEICPISNVHTHTVESIRDHPVRKLYDQGVKISIGDDDPVTSRTRVSKELTLLRQRLGFTLEELKKIQEMGINASFLRDGNKKAELMKRVSERWKEVIS